jgi:oxygen-independent coproporphyrinogen-3 oxidase
MMMNKEKRSIYIHIPFCKKKCIYCNFRSITDTSVVDDYIKGLIKEIVLYKDLLKTSIIETIYIGGGTPSFISEKYIVEIINTIKDYNSLSALEEFTIEVNPGTVTKEKLETYKGMGINRLSMGLQSSDNQMLKTIGRVHTFVEAKAAYALARAVGFENISLDLIFGLPGQNVKDFEVSINEVIRLQPEHISAYSLKVEEETPLFELIKGKELVLPDEDVDREMYKKLISLLKNNGYFLYEISNFSKKGFESKHNMAYWNRQEYFGFGLAAHGFLKNKRFGNTENFDDYFHLLSKNDRPIVKEEVLNKEDALFEEIMLGLRLKKGINFKKINQNYDIDFLKSHQNAIDFLVEEELIIISKEHLRLTMKGMNLSNQVIAQLVD